MPGASFSVLEVTVSGRVRFSCRGDGWLKDLLSKIPDQGVQKEEVEEEESFWTGLAPREGTPGVGSDGRISSLAQLDLASCSRQGVLEYCENTWTLTETLFSALNGKAWRYSYQNRGGTGN